MINKYKIKKIIFLILLISTTFSINTLNAKAIAGGYESGDDAPTKAPGSDPTSPSGDGIPDYGSKCDIYNCEISRSYSVKEEVKFGIKNYDGTLIAEDAFDPKLLTTKFLAGTYIMLRIYEEKTFISTASYTVSAKRQEWTCIYYRIEDLCVDWDEEGNCIQTVQRYIQEGSSTAECSCPPRGDLLVNPIFKGWKDVTGEYIGQCSAAAQPIKISLGPSYDAYYEDSNDIDTENKYDNQGNYDDTSDIVEGGDCGEPVKGTIKPKNEDGKYISGNTLSGSCSASYNRTETICMNVKTAEVRYTDGKCNENGYENEYEITQDEDGYWKYFIPLNTSSTDAFTVVLKPKAGGIKKRSGLCQNYIDKYDYYSYFMVDSNGQSFIGQNLTKEEAKERVKDGCYFQTTVAIPIEQKFYNELEDGSFKGFNFYYRPIDINNTFPNGLTDTSIWYDWYESDYKDPDLTESYNEITYFANTAGNENLIRRYNELQENRYTSWDKIYVSGVSDYIENEGIIDRRVDRDSFYALGCGPTNSTSDVNNVFYQQECVRQ